MKPPKLFGDNVMSMIRRWTSRLGRVKIVFTLATSGYCAIHWLFAHNLSIYMFSGAIALGAVAAAVAWLTQFAEGRPREGA